jgi:hypothetical protein
LRLLDRLDQELRIARGKMNGADHRVVALEELDKPRLFEDVARFRGHARQLGDLFRIARDCRYLMAAAAKFREQARTAWSGLI